MSIALSDGVTSVELHEDLYWSDEGWSPIEQTEDRSITGALLVQIGEKDQGRPITLQPIDPESAWCSRSVLDQLLVWAAVPGQELTLTLRGVAYTVMCRHQNVAVEFTPVVHYADVADADSYLVTLRLMTV